MISPLIFFTPKKKNIKSGQNPPIVTFGNKKAEEKGPLAHSLFIGRWQTVHEGHIKLIETVLKTGKPVVIAIRDTQISTKNPFSTTERWEMLHKAFAKWGSAVKIVVFPDIDEVCYGRDVGYAIRRIDLDKDTEEISATKARAKLFKTKTIIWFTGQSGSGKTTLANAINKIFDSVILDGDEMRASISLGIGFSKEAREEHNLRVARLSYTLSRQKTVIVPVIAPFSDTRKKIDSIAKPIWIHLHRNSIQNAPDRPYEDPVDPHLKIDTDKHTVLESVDMVIDFLRKNNHID